MIQVENDLIVHRYWRSQEAKERLFLVTKGDRLNQFDPLMPVESFIGQVTKRYRNQKVMTLLKPSGLQMNKLLYHLLRFEVKVKGPSLPKNDRVKTDRIGANVESTEKSGSNALNFLLYSLTHIVVGFTEFFANKNAPPD